MADKLNAQDSTLLLLAKSAFTDSDSDQEFFDYFDFKKDTSDVSLFFDSYLNSKGFERVLLNQKNWWEQRHPYRKRISTYDPSGFTKKWFDASRQMRPSIYTVDIHPLLSFATKRITDEKIYPMAFIGRRKKDVDVPYYWLLGHEGWHCKQPSNLFGPAPFKEGSAQKEALQLNSNTQKNEHDELEIEKHADKQGLIYLLYKEGIYDARSDKNITIEQVKKLREKYPELRPFKLMTDEQVLFLINNVAHISNRNPNAQYAKSGGKLNYLNLFE